MHLFPFNDLNDSEFLNILTNENQLPFDVIDKIKFNSFNFDEGDLLNDHIVNVPSCNYFFCDTPLSLRVNDQSFKILSYNNYMQYSITF